MMRFVPQHIYNFCASYGLFDNWVFVGMFTGIFTVDSINSLDELMKDRSILSGYLPVVNRYGRKLLTYQKNPYNGSITG